MSMLAERKRKTKWVINPTKTPLWTQDSSGIKFGKELMEKMGWSAGKGLGLKEQGIEEPIRLSYKNDTKGMGFKGRDDDWIEYQDEFNLLLSRLSENNDTAVVEDSEIKKPKIKSLELKSKHSRARVHYQKFTRGKDLSSYSENDLACILGINKPKKEESKPEKAKKADGKSEYETSFGITTINSGSMEDYFKKKYSFDKVKCGNSFKSDEATGNLNESFTNKNSIFPTSKESNKEVDVEEKKHKKRKRKSEADTVAYEGTENENEEEKCKKRKTSKSRAEADTVAYEGTENENEEEKCKKRKTSKSRAEADTVAYEGTENENEEEKCKKRKTSKSRAEADTVAYEGTENENEEEKCKKRKTSKSKAEPPKTIETEECEANEMEISEEKNDNSKTVEAKIKKKKRKYVKIDGVKENKSQISEDTKRTHSSPENESFHEVFKENNMKLKNEEKKSEHERHKLMLETEESTPVDPEDFRMSKEKKSKHERHKLMLETEESTPVDPEDFRMSKEKKSKHERHKLMLETEESTPVDPEDFRFAKEKKSKKKKHKLDLEVGGIEGFEVDGVGDADSPSEKYIKGSSELGDILEEKHKHRRRHASIETENDLSSGPVGVDESNPEVVNAKAEEKSGVVSEDRPYKEHHFTSERVLDLIRWADIKEFRGSNLGNVLGYGFKKEYLRNKVG